MSTKKVKKEKNKERPFVDSQDMPASYNRTSLTLVARDPYWVYAYWEIAPSSIEDIRKQIGSELERSVCVLRIYDVTCIDFNGTNANRQFDIEVGYANNWYVNLWNDNISLCADLGLRLSDGRFFRLARSNFVTTSRANPSNRREEMWMKKEPARHEMPYVFGTVEKKSGNAASRNSPRNNSASGRKISLTEDDIRLYYSNLSPLLRDIISARLGRRYRRNSPGLVNVALKNSGRSNFFIKNSAKKMKTGSSEEALLGASESLGGASEQGPAGRKFFFELGAELIVYGRTEKDAKVFLDDKRVTLRDDGTFTLRFALPDGRIKLPFVAISADEAEKREISTAVEREKTRYA